MSENTRVWYGCQAFLRPRIQRQPLAGSCSRNSLEEVTCAHSAGAPVTTDDLAALRLAAAHTAACAVQVADLMFDAAGGSSVYETSRLARCFRDAHMVTHHVGVGPRNIELVGQYLLGGPLQLGR